jgi:hypothetical protein
MPDDRFAQLGGNPLFCDIVNQPPQLVECRRRFGLNRELVHRRESQCPHDSQTVLAEPLSRVADCPNQPCRQILPTAERVNNACAFRERHCVNREVAAAQVFTEAAGKLDVVGPPIVAVFAVDSESRDFCRHIGDDYRQSPVLDSRIVDAKLV